MTDYKKLKAFAEELNPNFCEMGERNHFTHNRKRVLYKGKYGYLTVDSINSQVNSLCDSDEVNIDNLDEWINETREYWREQGLPSLQDKINKDIIIDELSPIDLSKNYLPKRNLGHGMIEEYFNDTKEEPVYKSIFNKTNKKSIMKNIKDTLKTFVYSKGDKEQIKAGLRTETNEWSDEAKEFAERSVIEELRDERLASKDFYNDMSKVAEERNKECK